MGGVCVYVFRKMTCAYVGTKREKLVASEVGMGRGKHNETIPSTNREHLSAWYIHILLMTFVLLYLDTLESCSESR